MSYLTLFNSLVGLAVFFGIFFAYNTVKEESKEFDYKEFFKILGLFLICGLVFVLFVDILFLVTRFLLWILINVFDFLKTQILSRNVGAILSLLAINAMGGYFLWEIWKERKEKSGFELSTSESLSTPIETKPVKAETTAKSVEPPQERVEKEEKKEDKVSLGKDKDKLQPLHEKLGISVKLSKILGESGITSVKELTVKTETEILQLKNCGEKSLEEIKAALKKENLSLKHS